jgi:signal transduction histidine kinase
MIAVAVRARDSSGTPALALRSSPFLGILLVGFLLFTIGSPRHWWWFAAAASLVVGACATAVWARWDRFPEVLAVTPAVLVVGSVVLLRQGQGGGASGFGALFLVPTLWVACYGTRAQLIVVLTAVVVAFWLPIAVIGGHSYPASQWRGGGLLVLVVAFIGVVIQQLIGTLLAEQSRRLEAERALREARAYEIHDDVVQDLTAAQLALAINDRPRAAAAIDRALKVAQAIVGDLLATHAPATPGSLVRTRRDKD